MAATDGVAVDDTQAEAGDEPVIESADPPPIRTGRWCIPALVGVFAASRVFYWMLGVRFNTSTIKNAWQVLPADLLEHDLIRSLWYLHAQPPLFNALVAAALRAPVSSTLVLNWFFLACGLALTLTMYSLMVELRVPPTFAFVATTLFVVRPTVVLYENWFLYTYPVALTLCLSAWFFARFVRTKRTWYAVGFGAALAVLAFTRATFHPVFLLAAGAFLLFLCPRDQRRRVVAALAVPFVLVLGLYVKNWIVFGEATSSSWTGMNFAHMVFRGEGSTVKADVASGVLSARSSQQPFQAIASYDVPLPHTGVPVLDLATGVGQTHPNFNNRAYIKVSDQFGSDAVTFARHHPLRYLSHVLKSYQTAYASPADYKGVARNRTHVAWLVSAEGHLMGQARGFPLAPAAGAPDWDQIEWLVVLQYAAVVLVGPALVIARLRGKRWRRPWIGATLVFVSFTVMYTSITSNALELGENMRFRFETDPLVWVVSAVLIAMVWSSLRSRSTGVVGSSHRPT